jgi:hypothetical protein
LSIFCVEQYFDEINDNRKALNDWSYEGKPSAAAGENKASLQPLAEHWAFPLLLTIGDTVEVDLGGGAFFPAAQSLKPLKGQMMCNTLMAIVRQQWTKV